MIYARDELQLPSPHYTMSEADMNNLTGRSDARVHSYAFSLPNQHCMKGGGDLQSNAVAGKEKESEIPKDARVFQVLLAGIVGISRTLMLAPVSTVKSILQFPILTLVFGAWKCSCENVVPHI